MVDETSTARISKGKATHLKLAEDELNPVELERVDYVLNVEIKRKSFSMTNRLLRTAD